MDQKLIDEIVTKAVERLLERMIAAAAKQHTLVLLSGAGSGYVVGMQALQLLGKAGHPLTVVMTASARHIIGEDKVRQAGVTRIIGDNEWVNTPKLVRAVDLVLVPTLSMNTAAHLALGLMDSLVTTLVLGALLAGKPVIAICDGANPYGNGGRVFSDTNEPAPLLRARLAEHLTALMDFGIQLVKEEAFLFSLASQLYTAGRQPPAPKAAPAPAAAPQLQSSFGPGTYLTAADLSAYPPGSTITLAQGAKLTPLAQEVAVRQQITLVYR